MPGGSRAISWPRMLCSVCQSLWKGKQQPPIMSQMRKRCRLYSFTMHALAFWPDYDMQLFLAVDYCCMAHMRADDHHGRVCRTLALIRIADDIAVCEERESELIRLFPKSCKVNMSCNVICSLILMKGCIRKYCDH